MNTIVIDGKPHLLLADAAQRAGLTKRHLGTLARQGRVLARRLKGDWIVEQQSLAAFVANRALRPRRGRPRKSESSPW